MGHRTRPVNGFKMTTREDIQIRIFTGLRQRCCGNFGLNQKWVQNLILHIHMICLLHHHRVATSKLMSVVRYMAHIWSPVGRIAWPMEHWKDAIRRLSNVSTVTTSLYLDPCQRSVAENNAQPHHFSSKISDG
ncbi:hypothetical protein SCLCIDRAFT_1124848 [Scleroderma citrinum Foug A]|uniref:Uncharacterized protein n=1 Tax=Scleroderma citrinum Foug A TaxID=1036808 RepID=A0A0C3DNY8_9AGAM|nr:hypothetical protein SCLCIDRAFT_1124848 [Scleroderma citrinum Foug A]